MTAAHGPRTVAAVLVAAGSGERLRASVPKAFVEVAGRSLLEHAAARFRDHPDIVDVVVVAPAELCHDAAVLTGLRTVPGGTVRQESVAAGLRALDTRHEFVLVHDVARPFVPSAVLDSVIAALRDGADAVVPVVPIHDTVRRVDQNGHLAGLVDRASLVAIQTPQGFRRAALMQAHADAPAAAATDDAGLVERQGGEIVAVPGSDDSFKITTPGDLARAAAVAALA